MFFTNALKDYVDQLNDLIFLLNDNFNLFTFLKFLFIYLFDSIKFGLIYFISCKWLTDFIELPCTFKTNYIAILEGKNIFELNVNPSFFQFLETKTLTNNYFISGFLNSFFLTLPLSVANLLSLRAFLINGLPAGIAAAAGTIVGQLTFFICVFFGFEFILIPFFSFEPINFILGFLILINLFYKMAHKPNMEVLNQSHLKILIFEFFSLNFLLSWTEQTSFFHYLGNLTITNTPTLLQGSVNGSVSSSISNFLSPNLNYLMGILFGSILWTIFFGFLFAVFRNFLSRISNIPFMFLNDKIHKFLFVLTFTFCLTSIPYYGFDYLISAPLGFISQDRSLNFFKAQSYYRSFDAIKGQTYTEMFLNPVPFDRTSQLEAQSPEKESDLSTFEDYSIAPENTWKNRQVLRTQNTKLQSTQSLRDTSIGNKNLQTEIQNESFKDKFYKSLKIDEKAKLTKLEQDIDELASKLFNPIAYEYYSDNTYSQLYTRQLFREKFYNNVVYKAFIHLDMVGFLQGQPDYYNLTAKEEADLYQRRFLLENYLNSIHDYKDLVLKKQNINSYAENVYNQQFKGSLDLVRHYFSISLSLDDNNANSKNLKKVLKFDQPLYKTYLNESNPLLHEELELELDLKQKSSQVKESAQTKKMEGFKMSQDSNFFQSKEETEATPFYIGWDSTLRKFLVKKASIPGIPFGIEAFSKSSDSLLSTGLPSYLSFQSWLLNLSDTNLKILVDKGLSIPYTPLSKENALKVAELFELENLQFDHAALKKSNLLQKQNLPIYNWNLISGPLKDPHLSSTLKTYINMGNTLPPQFGGFAWPGTILK